MSKKSFNKHKIDLKSDKRLTENDIICLTETQTLAIAALAGVFMIVRIPNYL